LRTRRQKRTDTGVVRNAEAQRRHRLAVGQRLSAAPQSMHAHVAVMTRRLSHLTPDSGLTSEPE
jgi:hypothetical protein